MSVRTTRSGGGGIRRARHLAVLGALLSALAVPAAASANSSNISTGQAFDLSLKTSLLGTLATVGPNVGPIVSNTTTSTSQSLLNLNTVLANLSVLSATVRTSNEGAQSTAKVAAANTFGTLPTINAKVITAQATATCRNGGTTTASSVGGTITIGGKTYPIASPPNTTIPAGPLGSVTLNEQIKSGNSITVNAIDVKSILGTQVIIGSASAGVSNCL